MLVQVFPVFAKRLPDLAEDVEQTLAELTLSSMTNNWHKATKHEDQSTTPRQLCNPSL